MTQKRAFVEILQRKDQRKPRELWGDQRLQIVTSEEAMHYAGIGRLDLISKEMKEVNCTNEAM